MLCVVILIHNVKINTITLQVDTIYTLLSVHPCFVKNYLKQICFNGN